MKLDDWQEEAINHKGDLLLATGRQVGKTFVMARKCSKYMLEHPHSHIIIASLSEDQAKLIIIMILDYLQKNHKKDIAIGKNKPTLNKVSLKNGAFCLARPVGNTGDAIRGFTGDVLVLDEVARFNELILLSAKPTLASTGGELWLCSTFFGRENYFYKCFLNKNGRFKVIHKTTPEVYQNREISADWTEETKAKALKFLEDEKSEMTELQYAQEYLGMAVEDLKQFFPDHLISECMNLNRAQENHYPFGDNYLGIDVARMGADDTVLASLVRTDKKKLYMFDLQIIKKTLLTDTVRLILDKDRKHNYKKIYIDDGGLGVGVFDPLLENEQTKRKIEGINNSKRSINKEEGRKKLIKEDIYSNLLYLMENKKIQLFDDPEIRLSLKSVQYEYHEGKLKIFGKYTHIAEALVRAAWCMKDKSLNIWIQSN